MKELSPQQKLFVSEYLVDKNATQAAIRAGYSPPTASQQSSKMLNYEHIRAAIDEQIEKQVSRTLVSADYVINGLKEVAQRCMQRVPVMVGRGEDRQQLEDEETGEGVWEFDSSGANKAFELLGKHLKLFTDKVDVDLRDTSEKFAKMSVEEKAKKLLADE